MLNLADNIVDESKLKRWGGKMEDEGKTKEQLIKELTAMRQRVAELEKSENDHKLAEETLRENEELFRLFMDYSPIYVFFKDEQIRSMQLSKNYEKMLGRPLHELIGKTMCDLFPSELAKSMVKDDLRILHEGKPIEVAEELDGRIYTTTKFPIIRDGKPPRLAGFTMDITEAKLAEKALRENEERFHTIFNAVSDAIFVQDLTTGAIIDVNQRMCDMYGYTHEEALQLNIGALSAAESPYTEQDALGWIRKAAGGEPQVFEWRAKNKAGRLFWVEVNMRRATIGGQDRLLFTVHDISKRKQAEEELLREKNFTDAVVNSVPGLLYLYDDQYHLMRWNNKLEELSGYSSEELSHMQILDWVEGEDKARIASAAQKVFMEGQASIEAHLVIKGGKKLPFYFTGVRLIISNRQYLTGIGLDLTEHKRAEEKMASLQEHLRQSQKLEAIGRLAGGIAHDFNNLLTVIKGYSQISLRELNEKDPLAENLREISTAANRASDLTRQLLAFSRKQMLEPKVLDPNNVIQGMEKMLRRMIGEDMELLIHSEKDLGRIKADPGQMEQVIFNLAVNARDAMPSGGKLILETDNVYLDEEYAKNHISVNPGHYVRLCVSDTGCGMEPEVRDCVFEPFFTTKERGKGTGLGLSTVYGIVKQSGGNIWVYSEVGKGTTFKIYFPRVDEPAEDLEEKRYTEAIPRGSETVLVVEDEDEVRILVVQMLRKQGYKVLEAPNSGEALMVCEQHQDPIHLILTDVVMPRMSGPEFIERMRQIRQDFKTLYMSGYTDKAVVHHGVTQGDMGFIQKPFTYEMLSRKVREVLDKGREDQFS